MYTMPICSTKPSFYANFSLHKQEVLLPLKRSFQLWFTNNCACFIHGYFLVTSATHMSLKAIKRWLTSTESTADKLTPSLMLKLCCQMMVVSDEIWLRQLKKTK